MASASSPAALTSSTSARSSVPSAPSDVREPSSPEPEPLPEAPEAPDAPGAPPPVPAAAGSGSGFGFGTGSGSGRGSRIEKIFVAVSTPPRWDDVDVDSRATAMRGSRSDLASGTGLALPGVGSADDSRCFDLSGDSPATDASSMSRTPTVRQPNRPRQP
ncbi:hypothetical protein ACIRU8_15330 [Streptomyces sp. NPDC101175]|uniref:hypothetical protein n=1 Tax=Streptomyces sp. NPDC101175 TaxID=3366123 RepID=UPI00383473B2